MRMTEGLIRDILDALMDAARKHKGTIEKLQVSEKLLAVEVEVKFTIRELTDKELLEAS